MASAGTDVSGLAGRYAAALFELADEQGALDQTAQDLATLKRMLADSADLRTLIRNPLLRRDDQTRAMLAVMEAAEMSDLTRRFVGLVASKKRLFALPAMVDAYLAELARRRGEVTARVTTAYPLTDSQQTAVEDALRQQAGGKVSVETVVDPAIIGGMIVKLGSRLVDSSVRTKLSKLQLAMKGVG